MFSGPELGAALRAAMALKGVTQQQVADAFGVRQSSVHEWLKYGRVAKSRIEPLVVYFSDVVGPAHWGLSIPLQGVFSVAPDSRSLQNAPTLKWGDLEGGMDLDGVAWVVVGSDEMAPRVRVGDQVLIDPAVPLGPGCLLLAEDAAGGWHVREYQDLGAGRWQAVAADSRLDRALDLLVVHLQSLLRPAPRRSGGIVPKNTGIAC